MIGNSTRTLAQAAAFGRAVEEGFCYLLMYEVGRRERLREVYGQYPTVGAIRGEEGMLNDVSHLILEVVGPDACHVRFRRIGEPVQDCNAVILSMDRPCVTLGGVVPVSKEAFSVYLGDDPMFEEGSLARAEQKKACEELAAIVGCPERLFVNERKECPEGALAWTRGTRRQGGYLERDFSVYDESKYEQVVPGVADLIARSLLEGVTGEFGRKYEYSEPASPVLREWEVSGEVEPREWKLSASAAVNVAGLGEAGWRALLGTENLSGVDCLVPCDEDKQWLEGQVPDEVEVRTFQDVIEVGVPILGLVVFRERARVKGARGLDAVLRLCVSGSGCVVEEPDEPGGLSTVRSLYYKLRVEEDAEWGPPFVDVVD